MKTARFHNNVAVMVFQLCWRLPGAVNTLPIMTPRSLIWPAPLETLTTR
ncbi:hypothetical protein ACFLUA_00880 [Chloroflexota bacterium]